MPETVGGLWITDYEFTRSWGVEPASASGKGRIGVGESSAGISVGDYYVFAFGGIVFHGIVSSATEASERESGREYPFSMVDNRVRLGWGLVFGQWNMPEDPDIVHANPFPLPSGDAIDHMSGETVGFDQGVDFTGGLDGGEVGGDAGVDFGDGTIPDDGVLPSGLDPSSTSRGRLYGNIVPGQWGAQIKTYTPTPRSAASILAEAFASAIGGYEYALNFHSSQNQPVFNVDANSGMTLAALVAFMCDAQGLQVTLDGQRTLRFSRRGGSLVIPPLPAHVQRNGFSISSEPTRVRVVGDRVLVQMNSVDLEPDWRSEWEKWISEPAWLDEVKRIIGNDLLTPTITEDAAGRAELAARAREITVAEYIKAAGSEAEVEGATANYADYGRWGKASRMNIPAWTYIRDIVFRSYRIPDETLLFGVPMRAMEIHDTLLCAVEVTGEGDTTAIQYRQNPVEFYPPASAYVIAKGQPIDLIESADREALVRLRLKDMRTQWSEVQNFTVDADNRSIHFATPVFTDGDPEAGQSIVAFPNRGENGYEDFREDVGAESDYLRVCVPNPGYQITPAPVRCALTFKLGKYYKDFGTGPKWKTENCSFIAEHLLDPSGGPLEHDLVAPYTGDMRMPVPLEEGLLEMLYDDGKTAVELADEAAEGVIVRDGVEQEGSYIRHGVSGTSLTGAINRISIRINRVDGIQETVEFAKPRPTVGFISSRDVAHRVKSEELFSGQADLRREVRGLKAMSKLERMSINDKPKSTSHTVMPDLFKRPIGAENPSCTTYADPSGNGWLAGDLLWLNDEALPSLGGTVFGGVVVTSTATAVEGAEPAKYVTVATAGTVPVSVKCGTEPGVQLRANPGDTMASNKGFYPIGLLAHAAPVPGDDDEGSEGGSGGSGKTSALALVQLGAGGPEAGRFIVTLAQYSQRLYVSEGRVAWIDLGESGSSGGDGKRVEASLPMLGGKGLDESAYWDVSDGAVEIGEQYEVLCKIERDACEMLLQKVASDPEEEEDNDDDLWLIATITFKAHPEYPSKVVIDSFDQVWGSDIPWYTFDESSSSGSMGDSSSLSSSSGGSSAGSSNGGSSAGGSSGGSSDGGSGDTSFGFSSDSSSAGGSNGGSSAGGSDAGSSAGDSDAGSSIGTSGGSSDSEKSSNAIVRMPFHDTGFGAMATEESNQVLFNFGARGIQITGRVTRVKIDPRFLEVCEKDTIVVFGSPCSASPYAVGVMIEGDVLTLYAETLWWRRPKAVHLKLTGIRKGFLDWDMPPRFREQYVAAEKSNRAMYPRYDQQR